MAEESLPEELRRLLHDQGVVVKQDANVWTIIGSAESEFFRKLTTWSDAPSDTASAALPAELQKRGKA